MIPFVRLRLQLPYMRSTFCITSTDNYCASLVHKLYFNYAILLRNFSFHLSLDHFVRRLNAVSINLRGEENYILIRKRKTCWKSLVLIMCRLNGELMCIFDEYFIRFVLRNFTFGMRCIKEVWSILRNQFQSLGI